MQEYKVKAGDTLVKIAKMYGVTEGAIIRENKLKSELLQVGQILIIPFPIKTIRIKEIKIPKNNNYVYIPENFLKKDLKVHSIKEYVVFVLQGYGGDPEDGKERAKDDKNSSVDYNGLGKLTELNSKHVKVYVYSSSTTENTKNAVLKMINYFKKIYNDVKIILVGHSMGADNIVELTKENEDIFFDFIILLDIKDAAKKGTFSIDDDNINKNVKNALNYYQEGESIGGEKIEIEDKKITKGANILSPGSNHRSIDNDLKDYIIEDIKNFIDGKDAVEIATKRQLPNFDPKTSGSTNIFSN